MKIQVEDSKKVWSSPDNKVSIWDIFLDNGTKLQTKSEAIAAGGDFEVEAYEKNGKSYVRQVAKEGFQNGARGQAQERQFKADPVKQESIEWQCALKAAVEAVRDYYTLTGYASADREMPKLANYKRDIVDAVVTFTQTIEKKPTTVSEHTFPTTTSDDEGDQDEIDLPPVDQLVEPF